MSKAMKFKAVLIGDSAVGKTALFQRLENDAFQDSHIPTVGGAYTRISINSSNGYTYNIGLWDTAGQERFRNVVPMYFQSANIIIVVYDISNRESFENIGTWIDLANQKAPPDACYVLLGNKSDLEEQRAITLDEMEELKENLHFTEALETSAFNGKGIDMLISSLTSICDGIAKENNEPITDDQKEVEVNEQNNNEKQANQKPCC